MSDWWIDESYPRGPKEAYPLVTWTYLSRQAGKSLAEIANRITQVFIHAAPCLEELKPETEEPDPTKKSYPTSNQVNKSRRSYRR